MPDSHLLVDKKREALRQGILALGTQVEKALLASLETLRRHDLALARTIVNEDALINHERRAIEQQALVVLAAYRPAGSDLRMIGASLEMVSEMERIADYAAEVARALLRNANAELPESLLERIIALGTAAVALYAESLRAYAEGADADEARAIAAGDARIDSAEQALIDEAIAWMREHPAEARVGVALLAMGHHYERVADRATNIAERLVYIATGETPELD